jgi:hypothetical protein
VEPPVEPTASADPKDQQDIVPPPPASTEGACPPWLVVALEFLKGLNGPPGSCWPQLVQNLATLDKLMGYPEGRVSGLPIRRSLLTKQSLFSRLKPSNCPPKAALTLSLTGLIAGANTQTHLPSPMLPLIPSRSTTGGGPYSQSLALPLPVFLLVISAPWKRGQRPGKEE